MNGEEAFRKWAGSMCSSEEAVNLVDEMVEAPWDVEGYDSPTAAPRSFDSVAGYMALYESRDEVLVEAGNQVKFLESEGPDYVAAWFLRKAIDFGRVVRKDVSLVEVLDRVVDSVVDDGKVSGVGVARTRRFLVSNEEEIRSDILD